MSKKINFVLWNAGLSGGNRTVFQLCNGLSERGYDVSVTSLLRGGKHDWFGRVEAEFDYVGLRISERFARKVLLKSCDVDWSLKLTEAIPECTFNVATYFSTVYPVLWSKRGVPLYLVQHDERLFFEKNSLSWNVADLTYQLPLRKLTVSSWLTRLFGGCFVGNGIDLSVFENFGLERKYDVLFIVRDVSWKGKYFGLVDKISRLGYSVKVVENVSERELVMAYNSCRFFVFLGEMIEGFGLCQLESMRCGCFVITTPVTEYCVDKQNCFEVDLVEDVDSMAKKIVSLMESSKPVYVDVVKRGYSLASSLDFNNVVDRFEKVINNV